MSVFLVVAELITRAALAGALLSVIPFCSYLIRDIYTPTRKDPS